MNQTNNNYCTLYIVRHGQTDWNVQGITQGETDIPLNYEGIKQAKKIKKELDSINFDAVFSSDLIRAKKTAEIITMEKELAIETTRLLRERRYGKFDGTPYQKMEKFYKTWEKLSKEERMRYKPYEGYETDEEVIGRFITFIREVATMYPDKTVLIVCHGGIIRVLMNHLSDKTYLTGSISNTAYIKLESDGVDFFIREKQGIKNAN